MIGIILAGGYGKRLWPLAYDKPKALLPVAGRPALDYVTEKLIALNPPVTKIIISTNLKFQAQFQDWLQTGQHRDVELVPDTSRSEEEKPGAIGALATIAEEADDDLLVAAADNLFTDDLTALMHLFHEKYAPVVMVFQARDLEEVKRGSEVALDDGNRILDFVEKPMNPKTTLTGGCVYAFPRRIRERLREYLESDLPSDEPGRFIQWLCKQEHVYGYVLKEYLWDMGTPELYRAAGEYFSRKLIEAA